MHQVMSALGPANFTSLAVALIALVGVLVSTSWTNWSSDRRRRRDQEDEDRRRREEREFEFVSAEVVRQREEVSRCVEAIRSSAEADFQGGSELITIFSERISSGDPIAELEAKAIKAQRRAEFYLGAINATERLRLELVHPAVRQEASVLAQILIDESNDFARLHQSNMSLWLDYPSSNPYISEGVNKAIIALVHSAFEHLHLRDLSNDGCS